MPQILLYFLAIFCLSTSAQFAKLNHMPPDVLGFWRLFIAAFALGLWTYFVKKEKFFALRKDPKALGWVIFSGFFFFLHLWTFKYASKNTLISNTMIIFATNPVWASIGGIAFFQERLSFRLITAYLLAFAGVFLLVQSDLHFTPEHGPGNWAILASALFYSIYMLSGKKARQTVSNWSYSSIQFATCALCFLIMTLITGHEFTGYDAISWWSVAGLILLPTFLGHFSLTHLVKTMNIGFLSCGKLIEPIIASFIAAYFFNEHLATEAYVAFALTAAGITILFWPSLKKSITLRQRKF